MSRPTAEGALDVSAVFAARRARPSSRHLHVARLISLLVVVAGLRYLWERASTIGGTGIFGLAFYAVECLAFAVLVLSALMLARAGRRSRAVRGAAAGSLDVFVTVCGEPLEMAERTLLAALAIDYPHRTYVLNDGLLAGMDDWEEVERLAERHGAPCFTRTEGSRGKAGNLNHALDRTGGEFIVTIDADHLATPDLAAETLGYFVNERVAFVCTSQLFQTAGRDVLNNREPLFYRFLQPAKDADSSAFSCGNGTVYRRAALESVDGFSEWNLVEDLHTSYVLHAAGWKSVYHDSPVTIGSAPQTASVFLRQRLRWATDSTRLLTRDSPLVKRGLSPMQRLHYLHTTSYYLLAGLQLCFVIGPPLTVFLGVPIFNTGATVPYVLAAVPYFAAIVAFLTVHGDRGGSLPIVQSALFSAPVYIVAAVRAIFGLRPDSRPTEKDRQRWFSPLLVPQICVFAALGGTIVFAALRDDRTSVVAIFWASVMAFLLAGPLSAVNARPALERMLRGTIRGAIVLLATLAVASQLATRSAASGASRSCPTAASVPATPGGTLALDADVDGAYFGISQPNLPVCTSAIRDWSSSYGFRPAVVNWFQQWRSGETAFRSDWLRRVEEQGAIPMVTWEPWAKPSRSFHDAVQPASRLARIVAGRDDAYIRSWARAAARYRDPILLRPMQEMNGTWYPWSVATNGNDAATFVAAWRRIHRIFAHAGADNVRWVWTVHALPGRAPRLSPFYPGAAFVDWVSLTVFNWGDAVGWGKWENLDKLIAPTYEALVDFHKPVMISEIGTVAKGGDAADWVSETMRRLHERYTRVRAVVWFSYRYSRRADFRLRGRSVSALRAALASPYWRSGAAAATASNPIQTENSLGGTEPSVWLQPPTPPTAIEGWGSELSLLPGEQVHLHVSTKEGDRYRVELYRLGWYGGLGARLVACSPSCGGDQVGHHYGVHIESGLIRADWPVTDTISIPTAAVSGYYYALLRVTSGGDDTGARGWVAFVVRDPSTRRSQVLVQVPVNTWQAYNPWGGKSLYPFNSTDEAPALRVSFDRPLANTAQGPFEWEYNLVRFLEREGYDVSYQTDADTDTRPESLLDHRLVVVNGHGEYWTKRMRDAFNSARNAGTNLAFTGTNDAYWQVRYQDGQRTLVGYKEAAPDPEPNPALRTIRFRSLAPARPECALMGVMFLRLREQQSGPVDYTVTPAGESNPWLAGTGLHVGDKILDVVGNEWDSLPDAPIPDVCKKPNLKVLFHFEGAPANADAVRYTATSGARVFAGGAQQLSWTLDIFNLTRFGRTLPPDPRLQQFVRNVLTDLTRPARPTSLQVQVQGRTVTLTTSGYPDPRVKFRSFKHAGGGSFGLTDSGVLTLCTNKTGNCIIRNVAPGAYRYAAVTVDEWGRSLPIFTGKVVVPPPA